MFSQNESSKSSINEFNDSIKIFGLKRGAE